MKKVISNAENSKLYNELNNAINSYKKLCPDKYTSLEQICYCDFIAERIFPYMRDLAIQQGENTDINDLLMQSHKVWCESYNEGNIDNFSRSIN